MSAKRWKFTLNTFSSATRDSHSLMGEILRDHLPKLASVAAHHPEFATVAGETAALLETWQALENEVTNCEALAPALNMGFVDKMESLTRKPDVETNSILEAWDIVIRGTVARGGRIYKSLLPHSRETLTVGTVHERLVAMKGFAMRLGEQETKPALVALGVTVMDFYNLLDGLHSAVVDARNLLASKRADLEHLRRTVAAQLFRNVGQAMMIWNTPANIRRIEDLFDLALLRDAIPEAPDAPALPAWDPVARTLTAPELPARATRLEAWRLGPGGAPELLAIGEKGALTVTIPARFIFDPEKLYQLTLRARNSRGTSPASPPVNWEA
jgi:hypothetical protein